MQDTLLNFQKNFLFQKMAAIFEFFTEMDKLYFIALIHPIQWTIANPVGADRPPNARKRRPVFPPAGRSQYCAFARWLMVFTSCLDNMTSYHLFRLARVLCRRVFNISRVLRKKCAL